MDGLKMVVPNSCEKANIIIDLFGERICECEACKRGDIRGHIGEKCLIRDWDKKKPAGWKDEAGVDPHSQPWQKIPFVSLLNGRE
jgi:hypothetical protein